MPRATKEITTKHIGSVGKSLILQLPTAVAGECKISDSFYRNFESKTVISNVDGLPFDP